MMQPTSTHTLYVTNIPGVGQSLHSYVTTFPLDTLERVAHPSINLLWTVYNGASVNQCHV